MSEECKRCHESFDVPYPLEPLASGLCGSCADAIVVELEAENKRLWDVLEYCWPMFDFIIKKMGPFGSQYVHGEPDDRTYVDMMKCEAERLLDNASMAKRKYDKII